MISTYSSHGSFVSELLHLCALLPPESRESQSFVAAASSDKTMSWPCVLQNAGPSEKPGANEDRRRVGGRKEDIAFGATTDAGILKRGHPRA